jgi:hypoxanthine-guanine phosphoribosyltransferase
LNLGFQFHPCSGALAVHTAVLLAKDKPRAEEVEADYVGFGIGDEFVVGYGLDDQGKYRNLPYVGVLKTSAAVLRQSDLKLRLWIAFEVLGAL